MAASSHSVIDGGECWRSLPSVVKTALEKVACVAARNWGRDATVPSPPRPALKNAITVQAHATASNGFERSTKGAS